MKRIHKMILTCTLITTHFAHSMDTRPLQFSSYPRHELLGHPADLDALHQGMKVKYLQHQHEVAQYGDIQSLVEQAKRENERKNYSVAFHTFIKAATVAGDGNDQQASNEAFTLADFQREFLEKDKIIESFEIAVGSGNMEALFRFGMLFREWDNLETAEKMWQLSAKLGDHKSLSFLAMMYERGNEREVDKALGYYELAAENGQTSRYHEMGALLKRQAHTFHNKQDPRMLSTLQSAANAYSLGIDAHDPISAKGLANLLSDLRHYNNIQIPADNDRKIIWAYQKAIKYCCSSHDYMLKDLHDSLGRKFYECQQYENAIKHFTQANNWHELGNIYVKLGQLDKADNAYAHLAEDWKVYGNICYGHFLDKIRNDSPRAIEQYKRAIQIGDTSEHVKQAALATARIHLRIKNFKTTELFLILAIIAGNNRFPFKDGLEELKNLYIGQNIDQLEPWKQEFVKLPLTVSFDDFSFSYSPEAKQLQSLVLSNNEFKVIINLCDINGS